jgi:polyhydroxybutyrate depolymerase
VRVRPVAIAVVLLLAAAGCSGDDDDEAAPTTTTTTEAIATTTTTAPPAIAPESDPVGTVLHRTLTVDGRERTYRLYVPSQLPTGPAPLFLALHGGTGWGDQFAQTNHVEGLAESNGFLVVHPDGVKVADGPGGVWNGGMCCGPAVRDGVDDVAFVDALLDTIEAEHDVDPGRVYAFGHSNGGIMSYRLACELADRIVGIGAVAGTLGVEACAPSQPVSVLHVHGIEDENLPITGGVGPRSIAGVSFPPPLEGFATLADADGCPAPEDTTDGDITVSLRSPCDADTSAAFVTIETATHAWPGGTPIITPASGAGYEGYDATVELVTFLLAHPRVG